MTFTARKMKWGGLTISILDFLTDKTLLENG